MKVHIEVVPDLPETEVTIRCNQMDGAVQKLQAAILEQREPPKMVFYKQNREFYFPLDEVLFFETDSEQVYAHTLADAFRIRYRLYELEEELPSQFIRVSKSAIVNAARIFSITREIPSASLVQFAGTHKQIYVSRHYYKALRGRMKERSLYEER